MRIFCRPPVAINASLAATSRPLTKADIAIRLEAPRMIPSIVRSERNLCAQISLSPMLMALQRFTTNRWRGGAMEKWSDGASRLQHSILSPRGTSGERTEERGIQRPSSPRPSPPSDGGEGVLWLRLRRDGLHGSFSIRLRLLCSRALFGLARCMFRVDPVQPAQFRIDDFGNFAVADFDAARGGSGDFRIVRDEGDGPALMTERAEQFQDHFAGVRVEVAGGFIG